jgi:hypothetical protein
MQHLRKIETIMELVFLGLVGTFFILMFVDSFNWRSVDAVAPRVFVAVGAVAWVLVLGSLLRRIAGSDTGPATPAEIMDMDFGDVDAPARARAFRFAAFIILLNLGIWLLGFHIAVPLGVAVYAWKYGPMKWYWALVVGLFFVVFIAGIIDSMISVLWNKPALLSLGETVMEWLR